MSHAYIFNLSCRKRHPSEPSSVKRNLFKTSDLFSPEKKEQLTATIATIVESLSHTQPPAPPPGYPPLAPQQGLASSQFAELEMLRQRLAILERTPQSLPTDGASTSQHWATDTRPKSPELSAAEKAAKTVATDEAQQPQTELERLRLENELLKSGQGLASKTPEVQNTKGKYH